MTSFEYSSVTFTGSNPVSEASKDTCNTLFGSAACASCKYGSKTHQQSPAAPAAANLRKRGMTREPERKRRVMYHFSGETGLLGRRRTRARAQRSSAKASHPQISRHPSETAQRSFHDACARHRWPADLG